ncbi:MAG: biopolymer transporter ExbD [Azoarcus sp.]|jgi:biopolymer transport protein ExbD|nr:biopolymer transporter ExbD [Azoarcus sp.]
MAFGSFDNKGRRQSMAEINMVPLIDIMLVLLVIFIVTAPLLSHSVKLELPKISTQLTQAVPDRIEFAIRANGGTYWNGEPVDRETARRRLAAESKKEPQPEVHIFADQRAEYLFVARALADVSQAGLSRIGFVSTPGE